MIKVYKVLLGPKAPGVILEAKAPEVIKVTQALHRTLSVIQAHKVITAVSVIPAVKVY